jgi:hypothetical protein
MKFNEPVRPAGIGRKQVAFDVDTNPSEFTLALSQDNATDGSNSTEAQLQATLAESVKLARVAAYSAASSAVVAGQNEVWSINKVATWTHSTTEPSYTGVSWIHWDGRTRDEAQRINSSLAYIDTEDPRIIRVRKKGWYLVNLWFRQTAFLHNNSQYSMYVVPWDSSDSEYTFRDIIDTDGYPVLRLSTLISIPGSNYYGQPSSPSDNHGDGGIACNFSTYTPGKTGETHTMDNTTVEASCQIVWLRPYEDEFTYNFA